MNQNRNLKIENQVHILFDANSVNEGFARMAVAAFMSDMNPTLEQICDVKTAVSEAVTNAIIHGYGDGANENIPEISVPQVEIICKRKGNRLEIQIVDQGVGIENVNQAMAPFYTTKKEEERSGMGFAFMEAFMDELQVDSKPGEGTIVTMTKYIVGEDEQ